MSSKRKIDSARANGKKSHGPGLLDSYNQDLQPTGPVEMEGFTTALLVRSEVQVPMMLVANGQRQMAAAPPAQCRNRPNNASVEHSFAFRSLSQSGCMAMLNRLESSLERAYTRALNTLLRLRRPSRSRPAKTLKNEPNPKNAHQTEPRAPASDPLRI